MIAACGTYSREMRVIVWLHLFAAFLLMSDTLTAARAEVPQLNHELERLQGFPEHQKEKQEFEAERLSGLKDLKKTQATQEGEQAAAIREYKVWKATIGKTPDESSPEYRQDQREKYQDNRAWEADRQRYSERREEFRREIERKRPLPECAEYEVCQPRTEAQMAKGRVPQKDRLLYGNKPEYLTGKLNLTGGTNNSAAGPVNNNQPPENDFVPPVPPPGNGPEFYEPAEPPPPPMPEGGFEDQVPPPVFDEP